MNELKEIKEIAFFLEEEPEEIILELDEIQIAGFYEKFSGPYRSTPKAWEEQTYNTKNKLMTDDFTVEVIPYDETSNEYGTTVVIAS